MSKDYYDILGVPRDADKAEVKKAFRRLAAKHHPDHAKDKVAAEKEFKKISEAYDTLGNDKKRSAYDQFGAAGASGGGNPFGGGGGGFQGGGFDAGGFGDIFEQFFGGQHQSGRGGAAHGPVRGSDMEVRINVSFEDAIFGTTAEFELQKIATCKHCKGNGAEPGTKIKTCDTCRGTGTITAVRQTVFGAMQHTAACPDCSGEGKIPEKKCSSCHGTGRERVQEKVKVKVPAGVDNGSVIRLAGKGEAGAKGGPAGDLFMHIAVKPSKDFERRGSEIYSKQIIHFVQAVLGDEVEIATVHGPAKLKIPAGTQSGQVFKLTGYGSPRLNSSEKGDHLVTIIVDIPKKLNKKEKELFTELAKEAGIEPTSKKGWFGI